MEEIVAESLQIIREWIYFNCWTTMKFTSAVQSVAAGSWVITEVIHIRHKSTFGAQNAARPTDWLFNVFNSVFCRVTSQKRITLHISTAGMCLFFDV